MDGYLAGGALQAFSAAVANLEVRDVVCMVLARVGLEALLSVIQRVAVSFVLGLFGVNFLG